MAMLSVLGVGCGGGGRALDIGDVGAGPRADAGSTVGDATMASDDASPGAVFTNTGGDGATASVVEDSPCVPGVYQGPFMTYIGGGPDGGGAGLFSFMDNGTLTIVLNQEKVMTITMAGGELPTTTSTTTLDIADGGSLDGSDMIGGRFFANLVGKLDCAADAGPPYRFAAVWANAEYANPFVTVPIVGNLTADYQEAGAATPPRLVNGTIFGGAVLTDGGQPYAMASGSWSATWIAPPP
jgi:hypothetical protein